MRLADHVRLAALVIWGIAGCVVVVADSGKAGDVALFSLFLPLTFAALQYGLRGGLMGAAFGLGVLFADVPESGWVAAGLDAAVFVAGGLSIGLYSEREKRREISYQNVVAQLSRAHENLQENFEGMKRAERLFALGQLSAGLAHEIRNPLASISGAVQLLRRGKGEQGGRVEECLEIIDKESQRLNRLLTSFLDFARPRPPQFRRVDVRELLESVAALGSHGLGRKQITLSTDVQWEVPWIDCDPEQLEQVLLNLTINAIQASEEGGEVVLRASQETAERLLIEVIDQGSGIKPEYIDKLFDPFFTTKENGTGLGLPVAHEIVRQLGGQLAATPNAGRGMTFSISLPRERRGTHELQTHPAGR